MNKINDNLYTFEGQQDIVSPQLVYYPAIIRENIRKMIDIAGGTARLWPHIKTHKMAEVVQMQIEAGIDRFKCATIAEAEMAAKAGAKQQNGCFLPPEQRHIFRRNATLCALFTGAQAALRQAGDGGADHRLYACKGNDTRPGAQCTLGCQQRSAPVKGTARHRQHTAKGALMAVPRAAGDILPDKFFGNFNSHHSTSGRTI